MAVVAEREELSALSCLLPQFPIFLSPRYAPPLLMTLNIKLHDDSGYKLIGVSGPKHPAVLAVVSALDRALAALSHFWISKFSDSFACGVESTYRSFNVEETAYLYVSELLWDRRYKLGFQPAETLQNVTLALSRENIHPSVAVKTILSVVDRTTRQLESNLASLHNPASALSDEILPRIPESVARLVFELVGSSVWLSFKTLYADDDALFVSKATAIRAKYGPWALAEVCGVSDQFRISFPRSIGVMNSLAVALETSPTLVPSALLRVLLQVVCSIKSEVLAASGQKLQSMDEIAPIFLFVVISAVGVVAPNALCKLLSETMLSEQRVESEGRVLVLFEGVSRLVVAECEFPRSCELVQGHPRTPASSMSRAASTVADLVGGSTTELVSPKSQGSETSLL